MAQDKWNVWPYSFAQNVTFSNNKKPDETYSSYVTCISNHNLAFKMKVLCFAKILLFCNELYTFAIIFALIYQWYSSG